MNFSLGVRTPTIGYRAARSSRCLVRAAAASEAKTTRVLSVPAGPAEQVNQAAAALESAWKAGVKRQRIELLLPLIGATDLDDWPGGIRQQFKAIQPLVENILRSVKQVDGLQGPLTPELWDDGDAVACYRSEKLAAIIFPTASVVDRIRKMLEGPNPPELVILINPQWEGKGNLISDFGIGPWRAAKEQFVATFNTSFWLRQQRIYGDQIRVLYAHPNQWQVHLQTPTGVNACIAARDALPTYQEIEDLLRARPDASINKSVSQRLQEEWEFNRKSLDQFKS